MVVDEAGDCEEELVGCAGEGALVGSVDNVVLVDGTDEFRLGSTLLSPWRCCYW